MLAVPAYLLIRELLSLNRLRATLIGGAIGMSVIGGLLSVAAPSLRNGLLGGGLIHGGSVLAAGFAAGALPGWLFWVLAGRPPGSRLARDPEP